MRNLKTLFIALSGFALTCCTNNLEEDLTQSVLPVTMQEQFQTYPDDFLTHENLSEDEIAFVAKVFAKDNLMSGADSRAVTDKEVEEIFPFLIDGGRILAYAVNYQGGGYSIISATQKYTPVIAYGEDGKISPDWANEESGFTFWMGLMKEDMVCQLNKKNNADSTVTNINMQWSDYTAKAAAITQYAANAALPEKSHTYWYTQERTNAMMSSFTDPSHMMSEDLDLYNDLMRKNYGGSINLLSDGEKEDFRRENLDLKTKYKKYGISESNVASYFWTEYKKDYDIINIEDFVPTQWHQLEPYNNFNTQKTDGTKGNQPLGCVTLAIAQIMNYYKYPQTLKRREGINTTTLNVDWNQTQDIVLDEETTNEMTPQFLRFVNQGVNTENGNDGSSSNIDKAEPFVKLNGYDTQQIKGLLTSTLIQEIKAKRPVYIEGKHSTAGGHAFVCCGYRSTSKILNMELKANHSFDVKSYATNPYSIYRSTDGSRLMTLEYFCFNWAFTNLSHSWVTKYVNSPLDLRGYNNDVKLLTIKKK